MDYLPLKKKKEFRRILKQGKRFSGEKVSILIAPSKEPRFAVCVGKKYGKSVRRNRIKRLLREAFRAHADKLEQSFGLLLIPKIAETYSYEEFRRDLGGLLRRAAGQTSAEGKSARSEDSV